MIKDNATDDPTLPADGIPVLRDVVAPGAIAAAADIPTLDPAQAVQLAPPAPLLSDELLNELTDSLQLALSRELDYAIDGAVSERLQAAMAEVAAEVKTTLHAQLEQLIPQLIQATVQQHHSAKEL